MTIGNFNIQFNTSVLTEEDLRRAKAKLAKRLEALK